MPSSFDNDDSSVQSRGGGASATPRRTAEEIARDVRLALLSNGTIGTETDSPGLDPTTPGCLRKGPGPADAGARTRHSAGPNGRLASLK